MDAHAVADQLVESLLQDEDLPEGLIRTVVESFVEERELTKEQKLEVLKAFKEIDEDELTRKETKIVESILGG